LAGNPYVAVGNIASYQPYMITNTTLHPEHLTENFEFITETQLMEYLKKGRTWIWNQKKLGRLKAYKVGRTNYYLLKEVQQLIYNGAWA
jgi:hypothetical protein